MFRFRRMSLLWVACGIAVVPAPTVLATQIPPRAIAPHRTLQQVVRELTAEARASQEQGKLVRPTPNFAADFKKKNGTDIPPHVVWTTFNRQISDDPFIDSYVRWQLTGFQQKMPELNDKAFERFITNLPAYQPNPRSNYQVIQKLNLALAREQLSEQEAEAASQLEIDLRKQVPISTALNRATNQLFLWIEKQVRDQGHRIHQLRLSRLARSVATGWNVERLKNEIRAGFQATQTDRTFTREQRQRVAQQAARLIGRRTPIVTRIAVVERVLQAQFDEAAIYDFEVNEWVRIMSGRLPDPTNQ